MNATRVLNNTPVITPNPSCANALAIKVALLALAIILLGSASILYFVLKYPIGAYVCCSIGIGLILSVAIFSCLKRGKKHDLPPQKSYDYTNGLSVKQGELEFDRVVKSGAKVDGYTAKQETLLHIAASLPHSTSIPFMEKILKESPSLIDLKDSAGNTALHICVREGNEEGARFLLEKGASKEIQNNKGELPFVLALEWDEFIGIESLKPKVNIQAKTQKGKTLLHLLANRTDWKGSLPYFQELLELKTLDINAIDENGDTAMHIAVRSEAHLFIRELAWKKARLGFANHNKENPVIVAMRIENGDLIHKNEELLKQNNALREKNEALCKENEENSPLIKRNNALIRKNLDLISHNQVLIQQTSSFTVMVEEMDPEENTCLHYAAFYGHLNIVDKLLNLLNIPNRKGQHELYFACLGGHLDVVQFLLQNGSVLEPEEGDIDGETPLFAAVRSGRLAIVEALFDTIDKVPDQLRQNNKGETPLQVALSLGFHEIAQYLTQDQLD